MCNYPILTQGGSDKKSALPFGGDTKSAPPFGSAVDFRNFIVFFWAETLGTLKSDIVSTKTSTINLFGFETFELKITQLPNPAGSNYPILTQGGSDKK